MALELDRSALDWLNSHPAGDRLAAVVGSAADAASAEQAADRAVAFAPLVGWVNPPPPPKKAKRLLRSAGYHAILTQHFEISMDSHPCGTVAAGTDPATSVLDPRGRKPLGDRRRLLPSGVGLLGRGSWPATRGLAVRILIGVAYREVVTMRTGFRAAAVGCSVGLLLAGCSASGRGPARRNRSAVCCRIGRRVGIGHFGESEHPDTRSSATAQARVGDPGAGELE